MMDDKTQSEGLGESKAGAKDSQPESQKVKKELSVVSLPHDNDIMAQEMAELFDEDRVTHQHGGSEPEKD